ncbi:MAG TPA: hypothetical protein VGZ47_10040 [Gemmataceae bacterium]|jgi:hypothetical protein|nr:hypothetical protein [Gemmataceae bacterium]
MPENNLDQAVNALIISTCPETSNLDAALEANRAIGELLADTSEEQKNAALDRLAPAMLVPGVEHPALLAMTCADIVDRGGNPLIAVDCVLVKVSQAVDELQEFVATCQKHARTAGEALSDADALGKYGGVVVQSQPHFDQAWRGLPFLCQSASAILNQATEAPDVVRHHLGLLEACRQLARLGDHKNLSDLKNLVTYLGVYADFDFALRVLTNPDAPGSFALAACTVFEFDADRIDRHRREEALGQLALAMRNEAFGFPAFLTRAAEVLLQHGGDAAIVIPAFLDRITHTLGLALEFIQACRAEWAKLPESEDIEANDEQIIAAVRGKVREKMDYHNQAWASLGSMAQSLVTLLAPSAEFRRMAREHPELTRRIAALDEVAENRTLGQVRFLRTIIRVLDGVEILVLHLEQRRGYRVKIGGIANLGQFQVLLAGALIGDPAERLLAGISYPPRIIAAARDQPADAMAQRVTPLFDLFEWQALRADGQLNEDYFLPPPMLPADISALDGMRIVSLRQSADKRTFNANRPLLRMRGELQIVQKLSETEVEQWLDRVRNAARK